MPNVLYRPRLPHNNEAPLSWFLKMYRFTIICWPLEDNVSHWIYWFDRLFWVLGFAVFLMHNEAELRYLHFYINDLDEMLTGIPTYLALIELHLRAFTLGCIKNDLKNLLKKFYAEIYIEKSTDSKIVKQIERNMWPIRIFSFFYLCALNSFIFTGVYFLATNKRELLYKMIPPVDYRNNFSIFLGLLLSNIWVGFIVATMMFGEGNTLGLLIFHLNGRYLMMRQSFTAKLDKILKRDLNCNIVQNYERLLREIVKENLRLNKFAQDVQNEFTFRIFVMFAFSAMTLCALGFKIYTSPVNSIAFVFWAIGKIQELIAFGEMGSIITHTTDQLSSMYYESNWEIVIARSSNTKANVRLMKLVNLCVLTNRKALHFTGLKFFNVSLNSVLTVLRGAGSYFTFLVSLR